MPEKVDLNVVGLFLLSHIYGITAGVILQQSFLAQGTQVVNQQPTSGITLFLMIGVATALMFLLYRFELTGLIKAWHLSALYLTALIFFSVFFPFLIAAGLATATFAIKHFTKDYWIRNVLETFSYAGAGALFGTMLGVTPALIFIGVLALYDIIAVFLTRHMLDLVEGGLSTGTFTGIIYPKEGSFDTISTDGEISGDGENKIGIVGGGDIIVPMMFSISLLKLYGLSAAVTSSVFAAAGLGLLIYKAEQDTFYPAIPIVGGASIIGWLLVLAL